MFRSTKHLTSVLLAIFLSAGAFYAATRGLHDQDLYQDAIRSGVFSEKLLPGTYSQDIVTIPVSILLAGLSLYYLVRPRTGIYIMMSGLTAYLFYAYGLFAIAGTFTSLYLLYLAIFGMAVFSLIFSLSSLHKAKPRINLPGRYRRWIAFFLLFIVLVFVVLWLLILVPAVRANSRPESYAVFVIDLSFVLPALAITSIRLLQDRKSAYFHAGIALVITFTLILSVLVGETMVPSVNYGMIMVYSAVTAISLVLGIIYFIKFRMVLKDTV